MIMRPKKNIKLEPFYFSMENCKLFGIVHLPRKRKYCAYAVVFCNPFGEEKINSHRFFFNYANELAELGILVMRFDYWGTGDSSGNFEDATFETRTRDILRACEVCREKYNCEKVILLGLRIGANLALKASSLVGYHCIAWAPVPDPYHYLFDFLRINLTTQTSTYKKIIRNRNELIKDLKNGEIVSVDGYLLTWNLFAEAHDFSLSSIISIPFRKDTLLLDIVKNVNRPTKKLHELFINSSFFAKKVDLRTIEETPFWISGISRYITRSTMICETTNAWIMEHVLG